MPSKIRLQRIADRIREELSEMLIMDIADPRLSGITITDVKIDRELAFANIYVSSPEGDERSAEILETLQHARGFLRSALAERIELRSHPALRFYWDHTPERADKIDRIINLLHKEADENANPDSTQE